MNHGSPAGFAAVVILRSWPRLWWEAPNIEAALTWGADETAATSEGMPALPYRVGPAWPAARGSARVRTRVAGPGKLVWAHVPWRRRDRDASEKAVLLIDARTGQSVQNLLPVEVSREVGEFVFEAPTVPGEYDLYYLPYQVEPAQWAYRIQYDRSKLTADPAWLELHHLQAEQLPAGNGNPCPAPRWSRFKRAASLTASIPWKSLPRAPKPSGCWPRIRPRTSFSSRKSASSPSA